MTLIWKTQKVSMYLQYCGERQDLLNDMATSGSFPTFFKKGCNLLYLLVLLALRLPRLGKRDLFARLFDLRLFGFVCFRFLFVSGIGCGLWLWHSLDLSLTFFKLWLQLWFIAHKSLSERVYSKKKEFTPSWNKFVFFWVDSFSEGRQSNFAIIGPLQCTQSPKH